MRCSSLAAGAATVGHQPPPMKESPALPPDILGQGFPQQELVPCPRSSVLRTGNLECLQVDIEKIVKKGEGRVKVGVMGRDSTKEIMPIEESVAEERPGMRLGL